MERYYEGCYGMPIQSQSGKILLLEGSTTYVAPSWSWASRNCKVWYGTRFHSLPMPPEAMTPECRLVDVKVELVGSESFGAVRSAVINVFGEAGSASLNAETDDFSFHPSNVENHPRECSSGWVPFRLDN